jgi:hypothetical protein
MAAPTATATTIATRKNSHGNGSAGVVETALIARRTIGLSPFLLDVRVFPDTVYHRLTLRH